MIYRFGEFELDRAGFELKRNGVSVAVEPQVLSLLLLLIEHRARMVSKDELIEKIWDGRFVSDAALASRVKAARKAIGDDGKNQRLIRTVHGRGLRFVGEIIVVGALAQLDAKTPEDLVNPTPVNSTRPSIAILPFGLMGVDDRYAGLARAIPHELISGLARLRWLTVIARGSAFRFHSDNADLREIGERLGVAYVLTGGIELFGNDLTVSAELADTRDLHVVWSERFAGKLDAIQELRAQIISAVVGALELQIPVNEAQWARLSGSHRLDAWAAFHLGLQHIYRFTAKDCEIAHGLFEGAVRLDPHMARARAGLSFIHFQNLFMGWAKDRTLETQQALNHAEAAMALDDQDPFVNFNLGRVFWLNGQLETGLSWLDRSTQLSPNYAQGHYARALNQIILGMDGEAEDHSALAMHLSPLDPLFYGMLGVRAMTCMQRGDGPGAVEWADKAARAPGAHAFIDVIALSAHHLAGDHDQAALWATQALARKPDMNQAQFFASFPFVDERLRRTVARAMAANGIR